MAMEETDHAKSCNPLCTHGTMYERKYSEDLRTNAQVHGKTDHTYIYIINKTQQSKTRQCITSHYILFQAILFHCIPCIYVLTVTCVTRIWKYINKYLYIYVYTIFFINIYIYNRPHRPNASQARRSASLRIEPRGQQRCSCIQHLRGCMGKDKRMNL